MINLNLSGRNFTLRKKTKPEGGINIEEIVSIVNYSCRSFGCIFINVNNNYWSRR